MITTILHGNLTKDPTLQSITTSKGTEAKVCNFTVAANSGFGDDRRTAYVRCAIWGPLAEIAATQMKKGLGVVVKGEPKVSVYQAKDGAWRAAFDMRVDDIEWDKPKETEAEPAPAAAPAAAPAVPVAAPANVQVTPDLINAVLAAINAQKAAAAPATEAVQVTEKMPDEIPF